MFLNGVVWKFFRFLAILVTKLLYAIFLNHDEHDPHVYSYRSFILSWHFILPAYDNACILMDKILCIG